jgi:hypothetical protein
MRDGRAVFSFQRTVGEVVTLDVRLGTGSGCWSSAGVDELVLVDESESVDLFGVADQPPGPVGGEHAVVVRADHGEVVDAVVAALTARHQVMGLEPAGVGTARHSAVRVAAADVALHVGW